MTTRTNSSLRGVREITTTALLAAIASILMFLDFALPIFPSFLKMDVSDVPALIAAFAIGPRAGVMVELIKNLVNLTHTSTGGIGELANFSIGIALVLPAGMLYRQKRTLQSALWGLTAGTLFMAALASVANYYVLIPLYSRLVPLDTIIAMYQAINPYADTLAKVVLMSIMPFNLLKGCIVSALTLLLYKRLVRVIRT